VTEAHWLTCADPAPLVNFLRGKRDRKLRLLFCASARTVWDRLDAPHRSAVEVAVRLADARSDLPEVAAARQAVCPGPHYEGTEAGQAAYWALGDAFPVWVLWNIADLHAEAEVARARAFGQTSLPRGAFHRFRRDQADLVREVVGNPYRAPGDEAEWRTADTLGLARGIYEERTFDRLPLLADALMDAGCHDEQLLGHCRGDGLHARGCWVVDLVLGKE
jgi:hypothetical protein